MKKSLKVVVKSLSWAIVSAFIIGASTYMASGMLTAAVISAIVAAAIKTPFYGVHEVVFEKVWNHFHRHENTTEPRVLHLIPPPHPEHRCRVCQRVG